MFQHFYLDFEKDIKTALSPEELKAQLNLIDTYEDRTDMQKAYLHQKAINRFWTNEIAKRGGMGDLYKFTSEVKSSEYVPVGSLGGYADFEMGTPRPFLTDYTPDKLKGSYIYPWLNASEGFTPLDIEYGTEGGYDEKAKTDVETLLGPKMHAHVEDGVVKKIEIKGEMFHPDDVGPAIMAIHHYKRGIPVTAKSITDYLAEEHDYFKPEIPSYIARDEEGKVNLYGTSVEGEPRIKQATDETGKVHTIYNPSDVKI